MVEKLPVKIIFTGVPIQITVYRVLLLFYMYTSNLKYYVFFLQNQLSNYAVTQMTPNILLEEITNEVGFCKHLALKYFSHCLYAQFKI